MVSPTPSQTDVIGTTARDRGFIPEETIVAAVPGNAAVTMYRPFWRPVVAGAIFALSLFVLSWYLMLGCGVGIDSTGHLMLGVGAAIWLWVTACVAYFVGGLIASAMTASNATMQSSASGWLKGAVLWGISIPLGLMIYAYLARTETILTSLSLPHPTFAATAVPAGVHSGFFWSAFITIALGLLFSLIGGLSGQTCGGAKQS